MENKKFGKFSDFAKNVNTEKDQKEAKLLEAQTAYAEKFKAKLEEFGVKSPSELSDEKKKEFFASLKETYTAVAEAEINVTALAQPVNQVTVQPDTMAPLATAVDNTKIGVVVGEPVSTDGTKTAKEIEDDILKLAATDTIKDTEKLQGDDITGADGTTPVKPGTTVESTSVADITPSTPIESTTDDEISGFIEKFFEFMSDEELAEFETLEEDALVAKMKELETKYATLVEARDKEIQETLTSTTRARRIPTFEEFMSESFDK